MQVFIWYIIQAFLLFQRSTSLAAIMTFKWAVYLKIHLLKKIAFKGTRPNIGRESDDRNRYRSISRLFGIGMCWLGLECRSDSDEIGADLIGKA